MGGRIPPVVVETFPLIGGGIPPGRYMEETTGSIKPESWYARPDLLDQILPLAAPIVGGRGKAFKWMEQANPHLDGQAPIDLAETDAGAARVIAYIQQYIADKAAGNNGP